MRRRPSGPWYTAYMLAITASSTCAVQMLLVAFSRRMCCSRVCRAMRPDVLRPLADRAVVRDLAVGRRVLQQRADHPGPELEAGGIGDHGLDAPRLRARADDGDRLRVAPVRDRRRPHARGGAGRPD